MVKILLGVGVLIILAGGAYYYIQSSQEEQTQEEPSQEIPIGDEGSPVGEEVMEREREAGEHEHEEGEAAEGHIIVYSEEGYSPNELTIHKGDTVSFRNENTRDMWPATAIHPSHTVYPGSSIQKCFDGESDTSLVFDSCGEIGEGEEWSFTFNEVGGWKYHDHLRAANWGSIIVEE